MAGVIETFGFSHSDVMRMPFRTFLAYSRLAATRSANTRIERQFQKALGG